MIAYFPKIYPDELVYSWFCRYYVHSGCLTNRMALQELLYKKCNNLSKEFLGHLNPEVEAKIKNKYDIETIILEHTMFPQYARFLPVPEKKKALYQLSHGFCDTNNLFSISPRKEGERNLKFCPLCVEEDRQRYGETYWHRKHQIRNMSICTKHKCRLEESNVIAKSEHTYTFCPAEGYVTNKKAILVDDNSLIISFAKYIEAIFEAEIDFNTEISINSILYDGMSRSKYLKSSGKSRYTKMLAEDMKKYYEKIGFYSIASIYQIQRVLLGKQFDFSVVCQIAFFLGMKVEELIAPSLTEEIVEQERNSHYMTEKVSINWQEYDDELSAILEKFVNDIYNGTVNEIGRPEKVSERAIYRELELSKYRLESMPKCQAIFEKYIESYPEHYARRILWAYQKLKEDKKERSFYWSDIRKLAGVKKKNFKAAIPYLEKYIDEATKKEIIDLVKMN